MRARSALSLVALTVLLGACGSPEQAAGHDLLFLSSRSGVTVVAAGAPSPTFQADDGLPASDWSVVVRAERAVKGMTRVTAVDPTSGAELWSRTLLGRYRVKVVSPGGLYVALAPRNERPYLWGRAATELIVTGETMPERTIELDGNYEPEAFSTDGDSLFVLEYLPHRAPFKYRVRRLDLITERVVGVFTVDAELQEAMRGTARVQKMSPDGTRLYTLYTLGVGDNRYAFIHVLALDELWAHCIDLPPEFATAAESATALSISPDGRRMFVANSVMGDIAEVDTRALSVLRTANVSFGLGNNALASNLQDDSFYLASGRKVSAIDALELAEIRSWTLPGKVTGLQVSRDGKQLYASLRKSVHVLDVASGERLEVLNPAGIERIAKLGDAPTPQLDIARQTIKCGC